MQCNNQKPVYFRADGRCNRPAISFAVRGAGGRPCMYGNGQREGHFIQQ